MDAQAQELTARIEARRLSKGMTKAELARAVGVARQVVNNWYSARTWPKPKEMLLLARALGTSISYLYGETDDPRPAPNWHTGEGPTSATEARTQQAARMLRDVAALLEGSGLEP